MTKAEVKANRYTGYCRNQSHKDYLAGYQQAEKDLALTWEDIKLIHELSEDVWEPNCDDQKCYEEVLRMFNEQRKK